MQEDKRNNVVALSRRPQEPKDQVLERLFKEHSAALRRFLGLRMGGGHEFEDIVQEVFVRLAQMDNLHERLPPGETSNRAFIFTVANNLLVDLQRHQSRRHKYREEQQARMRDDSEPLEPSPESVLLAREELEQVRGVIMTLRPRWRDSFILTRFMHKSYQDVANEMGVTVRQVERYVTKALVQIRKAAADIREAADHD